MRDLSPEILAALEQRALMLRDFLWFTVRTRDAGAPVSEGYWSDVGTVSAQVVNPKTGAVESRTFKGGGALIQGEPVPLVSNMTVQTVDFRVSQVHTDIERLLREYDPRQGRIELFRGLFNPDSKQLVAPAVARFTGFIDKIKVTTPPENEEGEIVITCASNTQEFTRSNPALRTDADQRRRLATDNFFQDVSVAGELEIFWGEEKSRVSVE